MRTKCSISIFASRISLQFRPRQWNITIQRFPYPLHHLRVGPMELHLAPVLVAETAVNFDSRYVHPGKFALVLHAKAL